MLRCVNYFTLLFRMKTNLFMKRILASVFTLATASTLATAGLYQSALAEDITIKVTESKTDYVAITDLPADGSDYAADAAVKVQWNNANSASTWYGYAYGANNTGSLGALSGSISVTDETISTASPRYIYLYALSNASDATIDSISGATISASNTAEATTYSVVLGIANDGTITSIDSGSSISATSVDYAYGIYSGYNYSGSIDNISDTTITATSTNRVSYGLVNDWFSSIGSISDTTITSTSTNGIAYGIINDYYSSIGSISNINITATSTNDKAYGLANWASLGSISGSITAIAGTSAYALHCYDGNTTWNFGGDTIIIAIGETASYAIYGEVYDSTEASITLTSVDAYGNAANATVSMTGDIYTDGSITIASGNYVLAGDSTTITATSMSISSGANISLTSDTIFDIETGTLTLDLTTYTVTTAAEIDSIANTAMLTINESASISGLNSIDIILNESDIWTDEMMDSIISDNSSALSGVSYTVYSGSTDSTAISSGTFGSIPEPSTATLSILALTALLARRKRRAALR